MKTTFKKGESSPACSVQLLAEVHGVLLVVGEEHHKKGNTLK